MEKLALLFTLFIFTTGCNQALRGLQAQSDLNTVPTEFENPQNDLRPIPELPQSPAPNLKPETKPEDQTKPNETPNKPNQNQSQKQTEVSRLIYFAQKTIETESRKLGTACNLFVHWVLQKAGFTYEVYLSNDFDQYAQKHFKTYKAVQFIYSPSAADTARLKQHIWSYPERTPFIMQWSRSGKHGHIAFVERIADKLVIYQSSLGTHAARKEQTSPEILLSGYNRRQLTVYSEMTAKP